MKKKNTLVGSKIRSIRVEELIGRGGMGEVYLGFDETLERKVALKSIRREQRLRPDARARFLREARVLSQLKHPNICQIHDYIEGEDFDLLVLELIPGQSLKQTPGDELEGSLKLKIAEQITQVLVAAHAEGIIHRDLKPDNVMLTPDGQAKVLDFGLSRSQNEVGAFGLDEQPAPAPAASAMDDDATVPGRPTQSSPSTRPGDFQTRLGSVLGTPAYMSPEQARGLQATPASDMYSLGVLLQELFTGQPAYDSAPDMLSFLLMAQQARTRPVTGIDQDLGALITRLTSGAPGSRPSAADTAERLAWIRNRPRRRRRTILSWSAAAMVFLFAIAMSVQSIRVSREAERANREAAVASQVSKFLVGLFKVSDPGEARGNSITARELLDAGAERIDEELLDQPAVRVRLMQTIGDVYRQLGLYEPSGHLLEQAAEVAERQLGGDDPAVAAILDSLGKHRHILGEFDQADALLRRALTIMEQNLGPNHVKVASVVNNLANLDQVRGRFDEAAPGYRRVLAIWEKNGISDQPDVAAALNNLAALHLEREEYDQALPLFEQALAIWETNFGEDHPDVALGLESIGNVHRYQGDFDRARALYERSLSIREATLGPDHPDVARILFNYAEILALQGDHARAVPNYERSLEILEGALGPEHAHLAYPLAGLGVTYASMERFTEAESMFERALELREAAFPADHPLVVKTREWYSEYLG